jgi:hypothetical protein
MDDTSPARRCASAATAALALEPGMEAPTRAGVVAPMPALCPTSAACDGGGGGGGGGGGLRRNMLSASVACVAVGGAGADGCARRPESGEFAADPGGRGDSNGSSDKDAAVRMSV